ncbi:aminotransferase class I/II-fold pyridoxal phosphate-dependent enzyme [Bacteroidota bacterium]
MGEAVKFNISAISLIVILRITATGFDIVKGIHHIIPIMLYDAKVIQEFVRLLLDEGVYVIAFFYPVVTKGQARIRV